MIKKFLNFYPFTVPGTVLFAAVFYLLGTGYADRNPYALFLSGTGFLLLICLYILAWIQARRVKKEPVFWNTSDALYAERTGTGQSITLSGFSAWFFFRVHFVLSGSLEAGVRERYRLLRENAGTGEDPIRVPVHFHFSGLFHASARLFIKDLFGLVRVFAGEEPERVLPVQPSLLRENLEVAVNASSGQDDKQHKKNADEEKYYMREYIPGDRFRDINWKATSRVGEMFTRISPVTEEKTKLIILDFRHFNAALSPQAQRVVHLEYLKRWCMTFLWQLKQNQPEYRCAVYTARGVYITETVQDIQRLSLAVSGLFYESDPNVPKDLTGVGEVYIFTTPFDTGIGDALHAYSGLRTYIYSTAFPREKGKEDSTFSLLRNQGVPLAPGGWIFSLQSGDGAGRFPVLPADVTKKVIGYKLL